MLHEIGKLSKYKVLVSTQLPSDTIIMSKEAFAELASNFQPAESEVAAKCSQPVGPAMTAGRTLTGVAPIMPCLCTMIVPHIDGMQFIPVRTCTQHGHLCKP
jgi:hypothetical protein